MDGGTLCQVQQAHLHSCRVIRFINLKIFEFSHFLRLASHLIRLLDQNLASLAQVCNNKLTSIHLSDITLVSSYCKAMTKLILMRNLALAVAKDDV